MTFWYSDYVLGWLDPTANTLGRVDLLSDDLALAAIDPLTYFADEDADVSLADIPGAAIIATFTPIVGVLIVPRGFTSDPVVFPGVPVGPDIGACVLYRDTGTPATSALILYLDDAAAGLPVITDGNDVQVNPGAGGWALL